MAASSTSGVEYNPDDEITIERKVVRVVEREQQFVRATTKMGAVDDRLIAIARGEVEPEVDCALFLMDDPFGGLFASAIAEDDPQEIAELDVEWGLQEIDAELDDPTDFSFFPHVIPMSAIPRLCMRASDLVALPIDHRSGFLLSHIDGERTVENVVDVSHLSPVDTLEVLGSLIALGAITID